MAKSLTTQTGAGWLFVGPAFSLIVLFLIVPFFMAVVFSFTDQRLVSPNPTEYVGLGNYERLFSMSILTLEAKKDDSGNVIMKDGEPEFPRLRPFTRDKEKYPEYHLMREWFHIDFSEDERTYVLATDVVFLKAVRNTLVFVIVVAPLQAMFGLFLALLINQKIAGINVFRTMYFMPVVISMVVVAMLWRFIYNGSSGILNTVLAFMTFDAFEPVDWLGNTSTALGSIIAMSIWQGVGFHMIIWLSGLQTISNSLYEAARIEGSSKWQTFRFVTWPGLRNTAILVMIIITMQAFTLYPQIAVMTNGGPLDSTQSLVFQMVERGYGKQDIAGGSTISVFLFLLVLSISLLQRWLTREKI